MIQVIVERDYPMLQALVLFLAFFVIIINMLVDMSYGWLRSKDTLALKGCECVNPKGKGCSPNRRLG